MTGPTTEVIVGVNVPEAPPVEPAQEIGGPLQQQDFHDTRELEAAESGGRPTPAGYPLQPSAKLALQEARKSMQNAIAWMEHAAQKVEEAHR